MLAAKGMVDARPKRGTVVRGRESWSLLDADMLRWQFESRTDTASCSQPRRGAHASSKPAAARLAAVRGTDDDLAALVTALQAMEEPAGGPRRRRRRPRLPPRPAAGDPQRAAAAHGGGDRDRRWQPRRARAQREGVENRAPSHRAVLDAVEGGDPDGGASRHGGAARAGGPGRSLVCHGWSEGGQRVKIVAHRDVPRPAALAVLPHRDRRGHRRLGRAGRRGPRRDRPRRRRGAGRVPHRPDPLRIEDHWQVLTKGGFYRGGPVLSSAVAGIDQALWDIAGKALRRARCTRCSAARCATRSGSTPGSAATSPAELARGHARRRSRRASPRSR